MKVCRPAKTLHSFTSSTKALSYRSRLKRSKRTHEGNLMLCTPPRDSLDFSSKDSRRMHEDIHSGSFMFTQLSFQTKLCTAFTSYMVPWSFWWDFCFCSSHGHLTMFQTTACSHTSHLGETISCVPTVWHVPTPIRLYTSINSN